MSYAYVPVPCAETVFSDSSGEEEGRREPGSCCLEGEVLTHSLLTPSLPHSLTPSLPHSLTASLPHSLTPSLPHPLTPSLPHSLTASLPHSLTASLPHSLTPSLPHSLTPSLPHSLTPSLPHCLTPSLPHSLTASLPHSLTPSLPHSLTPSLPHSSPALVWTWRQRPRPPRSLEWKTMLTSVWLPWPEERSQRSVRIWTSVMPYMEITYIY